MKTNKTTYFGYLIISFTLFGSMTSCKKSSGGQTPGIITQDFSFSTGSEGWTGDFADYPNDPLMIPMYQLAFGHATLPTPLNTSEGALRQSGMNHSDDLFMFIKKKITGLQGGKTYSVTLHIEIGSNVANNMVGIGGSPGEGVYIKAGAVAVEPLKILNTVDNHFRMNIDKANQSQSGTDMKVIGNFANGTNNNVYTLKQLSNTTPFTVKADSAGEIWLVAGTDSGFEGLTTIFYNSIKATIRPQ